MKFVMYAACMSRTLILCAAVLLAAPTAWAAEAAPPWAKGAIHVAGESMAKESRVPAEYDRDAILKLLLPEPLPISDTKVELAETLFVKPWKAMPGLSVAALHTETRKKGEFSDGATTFYVAVFSGGTAGAKPELKARGTFASAPGRRLQDLDLAAYRLAPNTLAFGVRTWVNWMMPGGGATNSYLWLFTLDGANLRRVWSTLLHSWKMYNRSMDEDGVPDKGVEGDTIAAVIAVQKSATRGFFDLRKSANKRSAVYRWDGTRYVRKGADPVENVNWDEGDE